MKRSVRWQLAWAFSFTFAASTASLPSCSSGGNASEPAADAATDTESPIDAHLADTGNTGNDGGGSDAADAGQFPCEPGDLSDVDPVLPEFTSGDAPAPAGGTIEPGRYVLTKMTLYFGDASVPPNPNNTYRTTNEFAGEEIRNTSATISAAADAGSAPPFYSVGTFTTSGPKILETPRCSSVPAIVGKPFSVSYTATPTTLYTYTFSTYTLINELTRR